MAENPTSSSTMYTTLGAPSGAFGGSNGVQSGTESRMSTLMVPLNALLIGPPPPFGILGAGPGVAHVLPARLGSAGRLGSAAEQLGLGGGEFLVGQRALLAQLVELVELIEHGRSLCRRGLRRRLLVLRRGLLVLRRGLLVLTLLLLRLKVREALILLVLRVLRFLRLPGHVPARRVRATADHGRAHQWASPHHDLPPRGCAGPGRAYSSSSPSSPSTPEGRERPRAIISSGAAATTRGPPTCGATAFNTPRRSSGVQPDPSALATCQRYEDGGASSAIRAAILTSEYVRPSRPLVACHSARASRPASSSSGSLRARPARVSLVAASTSTLLGTVMGQILSVGSQGGPMPGPPGGYLLPFGGGFGVTRQGGCGGGR